MNDTIEDGLYSQIPVSTTQSCADLIKELGYFDKPKSNNAIKRQMAKEHNRAYAAGELNKPVDLNEVVRDVIGVASKSLGLKGVGA